MAYPTILVHVDAAPCAAERIRLAAQLARQMGSHLIGAAATGVSRRVYALMPPEASDPTLGLHLDFLRQQAHTALAVFRDQCAALGAISCESKLLDDEAGAGIGLLARTADLVVLGQGQQGAPGAAELAADVIVDSARPVLLVPVAGATGPVGARILVAWDGGREAARALQLALPLLRQAAAVNLVVCAVAPGARPVAAAPTADPRAWLARHGVTASLTVHGIEAQARLHWRQAIGERLLSLAADGGADLLVMGAFGQSRWKESLLGGVTRTVLDSLTLPVLLAH